MTSECWRNLSGARSRTPHARTVHPSVTKKSEANMAGQWARTNVRQMIGRSRLGGMPSSFRTRFSSEEFDDIALLLFEPAEQRCDHDVQRKHARSLPPAAPMQFPDGAASVRLRSTAAGCLKILPTESPTLAAQSSAFETVALRERPSHSQPLSKQVVC